MATQTVGRPQRSYGDILKSSVLVGSSSAVNLVIGIVRAKAMALLLGPAGVGLAGLYNSISDITSTIAGLGVNSSGVRQIAAAMSSGDYELIARTTVVLRRVSILLGLLGALLLIGLSSQVSALTFGSKNYSAAICLLSLAVFFRLVSAGQAALIQGMRRISDLAKMGVWSACFGAFITIVVVFLFREKGIVPSFVCGAAVSIVISWRYSRKIQVQRPVMAAAEVGHEVAALLKLGLAFMATSLMTMGSAYVIRLIILRHVGLEGAGLYQAAWTLGGLYVGFILQAMSADFYPRLTASANNNAECNRLVNEQTSVGVLLGGPGVLATITLAPFAIAIFYSATFHASIELLRWFCLGTFLQIVSWPMGFIALAKGRQDMFLLSDFAWAVIYVILALLWVQACGLRGVGIAFFASYLFQTVLTFGIGRKLSAFSFSMDTKRLVMPFLFMVATVFAAFQVLPLAWAASIGLILTAVAVGSSVRMILRLAPGHLPQRLQCVLLRCSIRPTAQ